jgi:hypothetical protein
VNLKAVKIQARFQMAHPLEARSVDLPSSATSMTAPGIWRIQDNQRPLIERKGRRRKSEDAQMRQQAQSCNRTSRKAYRFKLILPDPAPAHALGQTAGEKKARWQVRARPAGVKESMPSMPRCSSRLGTCRIVLPVGPSTTNTDHY